jgi:transposase
MDVDALKPPTDIEALHRHYRAELTRQEALLAHRAEEIAYLREQVQLLLANRFGASREKVSEAQLGLFNEAELEVSVPEQKLEEPDTLTVPEHQRERARRKPLPEYLERVDIIHDLTESEKVCAEHGVALECFGEESAEQLDIVPAKVRVLRHKRLKYCCPCCEGYIVTAPMPAQPIPKGIASPGLLAYSATSKFLDALPLYRQVQIFSRMGVDVSRASLASWMVRCGALVQPLINLLREELLQCSYLQMDETTMQVLKEAGKAPESISYLWAQQSIDAQRPIFLFEYAPSRSGEVAKRLLDGFTGSVQVDAYAGYNAVVREQALVRLGCWAHARRRWVDVIKAQGLNPKKLPLKPPTKAKRALTGLGYIQSLYAIERRIKDDPPDERYRIRQRDSVPVLVKLKTWADRLRPKVVPKSKLGDALQYLNNQWPTLVRYCDDGRYRMDNNGIENAIRPFCLGKKNWLFADSVGGAKASANLYSLIHTAKANGLEPYAYLRHVFTELPKATSLEDIEALLLYHPALNLTNDLRSTS